MFLFACKPVEIPLRVRNVFDAVRGRTATYPGSLYDTHRFEAVLASLRFVSRDPSPKYILRTVSFAPFVRPAFFFAEIPQ